MILSILIGWEKLPPFKSRISTFVWQKFLSANQNLWLIRCVQNIPPNVFQICKKLILLNCSGWSLVLHWWWTFIWDVAPFGRSLHTIFRWPTNCFEKTCWNSLYWSSTKASTKTCTKSKWCVIYTLQSKWIVRMIVYTTISNTVCEVQAQPPMGEQNNWGQHLSVY